MSRFTRFSWGKIQFGRFAPCKRFDISQLCLYLPLFFICPCFLFTPAFPNSHTVFDLKRFELRRLVSGFCICRAFPLPSSSHSGLSSPASCFTPKPPALLCPPTSLPTLGQWVIKRSHILGGNSQVTPCFCEVEDRYHLSSAPLLQLLYPKPPWWHFDKMGEKKTYFAKFLVFLFPKHCNVDHNWVRQEDQFPLEAEGQRGWSIRKRNPSSERVF